MRSTRVGGRDAIEHDANEGRRSALEFSDTALIELRNRTIDDFVDGRTSDEAYRADLDAIAIEIDRLLSPDGQMPLQERAAQVVAQILAESEARGATIAPAKAARQEYWHRRHVERLRREGAHGDEAALIDEAALDAAEPDEIRMARPILAALSDEAIARDAGGRVRAMAERPQAPADPAPVPPFPDVVWIDDDRLSWEEFAGGVPCQGCGRPFLGDETRQRDGESWSAYRQRMEPTEAAFRSEHPDHGSSWTVGGGPSHCRRCCAPHPLSSDQIERINRILSRAASPPTTEVPVRLCKTCRKPIDGDHVCQLADLPKALRAVVESVLEQERARRSTS